MKFCIGFFLAALFFVICAWLAGYDFDHIDASVVDIFVACMLFSICAGIVAKDFL